MNEQLLAHRRQTIRWQRIHEATPPTPDEWAVLHSESMQYTLDPQLRPSHFSYYGALIMPVRAIMLGLTEQLRRCESPDTLLREAAENRSPLVTMILEANHVPDLSLSSTGHSSCVPSLRRAICHGIGTAARMQNRVYYRSAQNKSPRAEDYFETIRHGSLVNGIHLATSYMAFDDFVNSSQRVDAFNEELIQRQDDNGKYRIGCPASFSGAALRKFWLAYAHRQQYARSKRQLSLLSQKQ